MKLTLKFNPLRQMGLIICSIVSSFAFCAEPAIGKNTDLNNMILDVKHVSAMPQSADEALAVADHLNLISKTIQANQASILASGSIHDSINTSIISKLKTIIKIIEVQQKNLVDLISSESISNTSNPEKLNSIINSLDAQRTTLSNLITPELNSESNQQINVEDVITGNYVNKTFTVFKAN